MMYRRDTLSFVIELPGGQSRLRETVLYVSAACKDADRFGKVKLNKILWRADFQAFADRRMPVTGRTYQKLAAGPAPLEMPLVLAEMQAQGLLKLTRVEMADGYAEDRPTALAALSLRDFSQGDIDYVDESIQFYWTKSASNASDLSHGIAWKSRKFLDPIPYEAVFLSDAKLNPADCDRFAELAASNNWTSL